MSYSTDEIAKGARTTLRGVRLWESAGLLGDVPRNENGHRVFSDEHLRKAKCIAAAQMCAMTIAEIKEMFSRPIFGNTLLDKVWAAKEFFDEIETIVASDRGFDL